MADPQANSGEQLLRREIGWFLAALAVINATVGTGIFRLPGPIARQMGSEPATLAVWCVGGVIALTGALSIAELGAAMPRAGGLYEYLRRAYGPWAGFLLAWAKLMLLMPSAVGSFARLAAESTSALLGLPRQTARDNGIAVAFIVVAASVNLVHVRLSTLQQGAITVAKYAGIVALAAAGFWLGSESVAVPQAAPVAAEPIGGLVAFAVTTVAVMWAFDGWADLSALAGELKAPQRSLPRALIAGVLAVLVLYLGVNLSLLHALGYEGLRHSSTGGGLAASLVASAAFGNAGMRILNALIVVSCFGACMSSLLTGSRLFVPLSTDGEFPAWIGKVSPGSAVPRRAVAIGAVLGIVFVTLRSFEQLTEGFVVGAFPFYALVIAGVIILRRREPTLERPFKVPLYPWVPAIFLCGASAVIIGGLFDSDWILLASLALIVAGLPLRVLWRARARRAI